VAGPGGHNASPRPLIRHSQVNAELVKFLA
jgi:hypothetical protein